MAPGGRRHTLLVEGEGGQGIEPALRVAPLPYKELRIAKVEGGGEVRAIRVDREAAACEYLEGSTPLGAAGRAMRKVGSTRLRHHDPPLPARSNATGKVKESTTPLARGRGLDAVVLDDAADRPDGPES